MCMGSTLINCTLQLSLMEILAALVSFLVSATQQQAVRLNYSGPQFD
jgi:hypothetical protein